MCFFLCSLCYSLCGCIEPAPVILPEASEKHYRALHWPWVALIPDPDPVDSDALSIDVVTDTLLPQVVWHGYFIGAPIEPIETYYFSLAPFHSYLELYGERHYVGSWKGLELSHWVPPYNIQTWLAYPPLEEGGAFVVGFAFEQATGYDEIHYLAEVDIRRRPVIRYYDEYWREQRAEEMDALKETPSQAIRVGIECLWSSANTPQ